MAESGMNLSPPAHFRYSASILFKYVLDTQQSLYEVDSTAHIARNERAFGWQRETLENE